MKHKQTDNIFYSINRLHICVSRFLFLCVCVSVRITSQIATIHFRLNISIKSKKNAASCLGYLQSRNLVHVHHEHLFSELWTDSECGWGEYEREKDSKRLRENVRLRRGERQRIDPSKIFLSNSKRITKIKLQFVLLNWRDGETYSP